MNVYKVTINWHGESHIIYSTAKNEDKALNNACSKLAKLIGYNYQYVKGYINNNPTAWEVLQVEPNKKKETL